MNMRGGTFGSTSREIEYEAESRAEAYVADLEFTHEDAQEWGRNGACVQCGHEAPTWEGRCKRCVFDGAYSGYCMELEREQAQGGARE